MARIDAAAVLGAHGALVADQVRPGAAEARRAHRLMGIDHDVVLRRLLEGEQVVVDQRLAVVMLAVRDDVAHVAALHGIVAVLVHELVSLLHVALVIDGGRGGFVVHHEADALGMGVLVQARKVEVGIRRDEVEDGVLLMAEPVLPAFVPALDQEGVEAVLRREVDVTAHVLVVRAVTAVRFRGGIVRLAQPHGRIVVRIGPFALAGDHLPPHAHVLDGMDPGDVLDGARLVEVEDQTGGQHVRGLFAHHHRAPRALAGRLQAALHALGVRGQPRAEHVPVRQKEVRRGIIHHLGLMDVDVKAVIGLHLQRGLDAVRRETLGRGVPETHRLVADLDSRQLGLRVVVLLGVIIPRNPPRRMVAGHRELGQFLLDLEIGQCVLLRELVPEAQAVVIQAETHLHHVALAGGVPQVAGILRVRHAHAALGGPGGPRSLLQRYKKFIVVVPDGGFLAPDRLPGFVQGAEGGSCQCEPAVQVLFRVQQRVTEAGRQDNRLSGAVQRIFRHAVHDGELQFQLPIRTAEDDRVGRHFRGLGPAGGHEKDGRKGKDSFHIDWL